MILTINVLTSKKGEESTKSSLTDNVIKEKVTETIVSKSIEVTKEVSVKINRAEDVIFDVPDDGVFNVPDDALLNDDLEYKPTENKTSSNALSKKEWDDIEKYMIETGEINNHDTENKSDNEDELSSLTDEEYEFNTTLSSSESLSKEEWNNIEDSLELPPENIISQKRKIEFDDLQDSDIVESSSNK